MEIKMKGDRDMPQRWLRSLFGRRVLTILLLLLQVSQTGLVEVRTETGGVEVR